MTSPAFLLSRSHAMRPKSGQSGIILAVTMIVLVIMLVSSVALIRSFNTSVGIAGALALRRDLVNQSEQATNRVTNHNFLLADPLYITQGNRFLNRSASNYSACQLPVDVHGVPVLLSDDAHFADSTDLSSEPWSDALCQSAVAVTSNDITETTNGGGVMVRYVIDRLCAQTGAYSSTGCTTAPKSISKYKDQFSEYLNANRVPIYRISVRALDPRGGTTYLQTTFSN